MIIHLRNKKEIKGLYIEAISDNEIEVRGKNDITVDTFAMSELDYITNNANTESLTLSEITQGAYEFIEQYETYDEHNDIDVEVEKEITFNSLDEFDDYVFKEFSKPYMHFENEPNVTW